MRNCISWRLAKNLIFPFSLSDQSEVFLTAILSRLDTDKTRQRRPLNALAIIV